MRKEKETQRFSSLSLKIPIIEYSTSANQDICAIPILHILQFLETFRRKQAQRNDIAITSADGFMQKFIVRPGPYVCAEWEME